jgi:hypothetical protein
LVAGLVRSLPSAVPDAPARAAFAEAFRLAPEDPNTSLFHAWALSSTPDLDEAVRVLEAHAAIAGPDPRTERLRYRLTLRRDLLGPRRLSRRGGVSLLSSTDVDAARADAILRTVEGALVEAAALLGCGAPDELTVVVYATVGDLVSASCATSWAGGVYTGVLELSADREDPSLTAVARHETMHAAMQSASIRRSPGWFAEGVAQYFENDPPQRLAATRHLAELGRTISLRSMTDMFHELSHDADALLAYDQALGMVLWLVAVHGERVIAEGARWLASDSTESLFATLFGRPFDERAFLAFARSYAEREGAAGATPR